MQVRMSLWCSLAEYGWAVPPRSLTKAELVEEARLYQAMLEARPKRYEEELNTPSRSARMLVGFKEVSPTT